METSYQPAPSTEDERHPALNSAIPAEAMLLLHAQGKEILAAHGSQVVNYSLALDGSSVTQALRWFCELPGEALCLAESGLGLLVAYAQEGDSSIAVLDGAGKASPLVRIPGRISALAAAGSYAVAAAAAGTEAYGALYRIDLRGRKLTAHRSLASAKVELDLDNRGGLCVCDPAEGKVTLLQGNLEDAPRRQGEKIMERQRPAGHRVGCCCACCMPTGTDQGETGPERGENGGERPPGGEDRPADGGPEAGPVYPGNTGVPDGNGGAYIGNGRHVGLHPGGGDGAAQPCGVDLSWRVGKLSRAGQLLLASDVTRRNLALLSTPDLRILEERSFTRRAAPVLAASPQAPHLLMRLPGEINFQMLELDQVATRISPAALNLAPHLPPSGKTFEGMKTQSLIGGHAATMGKGTLNALIIPVIEKAQVYSEPDLNKVKAYFQRVLYPQVNEYYEENSFNQLSGLQFQVFGQDFQPGGGPVSLPRQFLTDYFYPSYDPGRLELYKGGLTAASEVIFDGREKLSVRAYPTTGGRKMDTIDFPFYALRWQQEHNLFPVQVRFAGSEKLDIHLVDTSGAARTLQLSFPAQTFNIQNQAEARARLDELETYLEGVFLAAESTAGVPQRIFGRPQVTQVKVTGKDFGLLVTGVPGAQTTGVKLRVTGLAPAGAGSNSAGQRNALAATFQAGRPQAIADYLQTLALVAQQRKGYDRALVILNPPSVDFNPTSGDLTTRIPISNRDGGPGATVMPDSAPKELASLFDSANNIMNSNTTSNLEHSVRDTQALFDDAFTGAAGRVIAANGGGENGRQAAEAFRQFNVVLVMPLDRLNPNPADPDTVLPGEAWNVTPLHRPFELRGIESMTTASYLPDPEKVQLQNVWSLVVFTDNKADIAMVCHEMGHGLGFRDLYFQDGYRDDLVYLEHWAMMSHHVNRPHHTGYHKLEAGWIHEKRVLTLPPAPSEHPLTAEALLVPVEVWRDSLFNSARLAFGVDGTVPVVQLIKLDLGGDGAIFDLIEARQKGVKASLHLPAEPAVLVTNALDWGVEKRIVMNGEYRREVHLLNRDNILQAAGDAFDLGFAPELAARGVKVEVVDRKPVEGDVTVFRIKVTRQAADFVDLYFQLGSPEYMSPDLWVDWAGDNQPDPQDPKYHHTYPAGMPTGQGEEVHVPPIGRDPAKPPTELHWVAARVRNRGAVEATDVIFNFFSCSPPGGGDQGVNFVQFGTTKVDRVEGGDKPQDVTVRWDIPPDFGVHRCLLVNIADYHVPHDETGEARASDDVWPFNNHAQKNVGIFVPLKGSPYAPVEFEYSVHNAGISPEIAYLEPDGLPYGMRLTVAPARQVVPAGQTVYFHCKLELDEEIVDAGCQSDSQFHLVTWRQEAESSARWGGVLYKVYPRKKDAVTLEGNWAYGDEVALHGQVSPDPGGGTLWLRLAYDNQDAAWEPLALKAGGVYTWTGKAPAGAYQLDALARFEGNKQYGPAQSAPKLLMPPTPVR